MDFINIFSKSFLLSKIFNTFQSLLEMSVSAASVNGLWILYFFNRWFYNLFFGWSTLIKVFKVLLAIDFFYTFDFEAVDQPVLPIIDKYLYFIKTKKQRKRSFSLRRKIKLIGILKTFYRSFTWCFTTGSISAANGNV